MMSLRLKYKPYLILILLGYILTGIEPVVGQGQFLVNTSEFQLDARNAIDSLYNRNNEAAREIISEWEKKVPEHPVWDLWTGMELWWEILEDLHNTTRDDEFFEAMQKADFKAGKLLNQEPENLDALLVRAVANGYAARHYSNRLEWIKSMGAGRRAYQIHQRLMSLYDDFPDNDLAEGLKFYYSAYLPEAYPVVKTISWFLPDGDKDKGIKLLKRSSREGVFSAPEASYFLGSIYLNYEDEFELAMEQFELLSTNYPDNSYYRRLVIRNLFAQKKYDAVIQESEKLIDYWKSKGNPGFSILAEEVLYWRGRAFFHRSEFEKAGSALNQAVESGKKNRDTKNRKFLTEAAYYSGLNAEKAGDLESAKMYYEFAANQNSGEEAVKRAKEKLNRI